jgi:hypothetical protein
MLGSVLRSTPIHELVIGTLKPQGIASLEALGCKVDCLNEQGAYKIAFPAGTQEEIRAGESTALTYKTHICFPDGSTLTKLVKVRLSNMDESVTFLCFS